MTCSGFLLDNFAGNGPLNCPPPPCSPANRKQAQQLQAQMAELDKKDIDLEASAASLRAKFAAQCGDMKIEVGAFVSCH